MRETKFRGKRLDNGEWVVGDLVRTWDKTLQWYIFEKESNGRAYELYQVDPITVGQYTGLKDKKRTKEYPDGQEIYEGDVVVFGDWKPKVIQYGPQFAGFLLAETMAFLMAYDTEKIEIIGNIHDEELTKK